MYNVYLDKTECTSSKLFNKVSILFHPTFGTMDQFVMLHFSKFYDSVQRTKWWEKNKDIYDLIFVS